MDLVANTYGIAVGLFFSPDYAGRFAAQTGHYISGPGETSPDSGGKGRYNGNPVEAWGKGYPFGP